MTGQPQRSPPGRSQGAPGHLAQALGSRRGAGPGLLFGAEQPTRRERGPLSRGNLPHSCLPNILQEKGRLPQHSQEASVRGADRHPCFPAHGSSVEGPSTPYPFLKLENENPHLLSPSQVLLTVFRLLSGNLLKLNMLKQRHRGDLPMCPHRTPHGILFRQLPASPNHPWGPSY